MKVLQYPIARITLAFVAGILIAFYSKPSLIPTFIFLLASVLVLVVASSGSKISTAKYFLTGIMIYFTAFLTGMSSYIIHTDSYTGTNYSHHSHLFDKETRLVVVVGERLKSTAYSDRYVANLSQIDDANYSGKVIVNIPKNQKNAAIQVGNYLQIFGQLQKNRPPTNPNQFDYGNYLTKKNIYAQLYADRANISIGKKSKKDIWYYSARLRNRILFVLQKNHFNKTELDIAAALLMGQRQDISPEIVQDYQYAGAIHILSVSGLHVGFILLFMNFFLKPIPNTKKGSFIKLAITLLILWLFAILAGLSPSVVRSVTMFSFVAIGYNLRRTVNIYHTLFVSIFLILLFQPSFLFDVGFQLSYIALFFIIWFQPLLKTVWTPSTKFLSYFWDILTVSFAAQIGTLPLTIYYFHQFPGLFFVTNLLVIPLLSFIMFAGIVLLSIASFGYAPEYLIKIVEWSIFLLNKIISIIASFEKFIITDISLNSYLLCSLYLLIISIIIWLKKPSSTRAIFFLTSLIVLQSSSIYTSYIIQRQKEWIVFNSKKETQIAERTGSKVVLSLNDSISEQSPQNIKLKSYLIANFSTVVSKSKLKNVAYFNGKKILIIDSTGVYPKNCSPDILLLIQSPKINLERMLQNLQPKVVVADASNYKSLLTAWSVSSKKQKIPFHATAEKGFYIIK
jgi:competence protein ComEC